MTQLSRREFAALAGATFAAPLAASQNPSRAQVSAQDVIDRIRTKIGVEWKPDSVDGIKAGEASAIGQGHRDDVDGDARRASARRQGGSNLVFTALPTFYSRTDARNPPRPDGRRSDRIFTAKNEFIAKHNIVIFRLSEHWRLRAARSARAGHGAGVGVDEISSTPPMPRASTCPS